MNYIIFDLESTCWENDRSKTREIIEIGAVKIDADKKTIDEFNAFIKPTIHPNLSEFCIDLTSISQEEVETAQTFPEVISDFKSWINLNKEYLLCSWGHYDRNQFKSDMKLHSLNAEWVEKHISLKHQYTELKNLKRPLGMNGALKLENFKLEGTHHRGIDDARNISKIFLKYFDDWKK